MKLIAFLLRRSPKALAVAVFAGLVSGAASTGLLATVHTALGRPSSPSPLLIVGFAALCVVAPAARVVSQFLLVRLAQRAIFELRDQLTRAILATPLRRLEEIGTPRLLAVLIDDIQVISQALANVPTLSVTLAIVSGCLLYLGALSLPLFVALLVIMVVGIVSYQLPLVAGQRRFSKAFKERDRLVDHFRSLLGGIQELKLHSSRQNAFARLVRETAHRLYRLSLAAYTIFDLASSWGHLLFFVVIGVLVFVMPSWEGVEHSDLVGYTIGLLYMMNPLQAILDVLPQVSRAGIALGEVEALGFSLARPAPIEEAAGKSLRPWRSLELRSAAFAFPGEDGHRFVLGPLDLRLRPGELTFLVGGNGSGKTTLAKVLVGLYECDQGGILLDGEAVTAERRETYRQYFSVVFAVPHLFEGLLGLEAAGLDEKARSYLAALELDHKVKIEDGSFSTTALSQGQKKRLALLTACLEERPILVFDEWAADQDPIFRDLFYRKILPELKAEGKTLLVISHDDRYFGVADRILKMESGQLVYDGDVAGLAAASPAAPRREPLAPVLPSSRPAAPEPAPAAPVVAPVAALVPRRRRWARLALATSGLALVAALSGGLWLRGELRASLPPLAGEVSAPSLAAPAEVERDGLGVPTIRAAGRRDVAFATGFVHAQDRFFQMDLLRRRAAGELAELFGDAVLETDVAARRHRFRHRAEGYLAAQSPEVRDLLAAYAEGVAAGLRSLAEAPPEYLALGLEPRPWRPEDSLLVLLSMFVQLQEANGAIEEAASLMHEVLPPELDAFLRPAGTEWDAPVEGTTLTGPPMPGPDVIDLRRTVSALAPPGALAVPGEPEPVAGSNGWALAPGHTAAGAALLANDLHLGLGLPNVWYRAVFVWPRADGAGEHRVAGVTLPGLPTMALGSNGRVAWGLTNAVIDTRDLVLLELDPADGRRYRTPEGWEAFRVADEVVHVRGGAERHVEVLETRWGPVVDEDPRGRPRALSWTAHLPEAVNLESWRLETATQVSEALEIAAVSGGPAMNFLAVDADGHIGWTLLGRVPRRVGFDGRLATSWASGERGWDGLADPAIVPRLLDPPSGRLWNANQRMVDGEGFALLGDGNHPLGARARQIRDALAELEGATPRDMLSLQLDDRALFLARWRELVLAVLTPEAVGANPRRATFRALVEDWGGHAAVDSAGYRMVRTFRVRLARGVFRALTARCRDVEESFDYTLRFRQFEGPLWQIVSERPAHLLDPRHGSWDDYFLAAVDEAIAYFDGVGDDLRERTWGERNTVSLHHPLSLAVPALGIWLDTPALQLPGDEDMPRVQSDDFGATVRMVVSPGREDEGIFEMPGGQSGHPLSPHYRDAHMAWARGEATPFLPGPPVHVLRLVP